MSQHTRKSNRPHLYLIREQRVLDDCVSLQHSRDSRKFNIRLLLKQIADEHSRPPLSTRISQDLNQSTSNFANTPRETTEFMIRPCDSNLKIRLEELAGPIRNRVKKSVD